jgi:outer membrane receptor protein involved in Fe transport
MLSLVGFISRIDKSIMEDPYAGLSLPNHQTIPGIELEASYAPHATLDLRANLTLLDNSGPDETYLDTIFFLDPDGNIVEETIELKYPYDIGASSLFNLMATWKPLERISLYGRLGYTGPRQLIYPLGEQFPEAPGHWQLDLTATYKDLYFKGLDLQIALRNLIDSRYETPGTYTMIEGEPLTATILLRKRW